MRKSCLLLFLVALTISSLDRVAGQSSTPKAPLQANINNEKTAPHNEASSGLTVPVERKTAAMKLYSDGIDLAEAGQFTQAVEHFQQAVKLDPKYAEAYSALGRAYFKLQQWQKAADNLHRASELNAKQREVQASIRPTLSMQTGDDPRVAKAPTDIPAQKNFVPSNTGSVTTATGSANQSLTSKVNQQSPVTTPRPAPVNTPPIVNQQANANAGGTSVSIQKAAVTIPPLKSVQANNAHVVERTVRSAPSLPMSRLSGEIELAAGNLLPLASEAEKTGVEPGVPSRGANPSALDENNAVEKAIQPVGVRVSMSEPPPMTPEPINFAPLATNSSTNDAALTAIYRVGPGDVLDVRVNDSQLTQSTLFTISPSGFLEHPLFTEPFLVSGLTVDEISSRIENDFKRRALMDDPRITIGVRDYASHSILVSGLVKDAGTKFLRREAIPLYVVVADAQPLPEAATVTVVRTESNRVFEIDLSQTAEMNLLIRPGDVITLRPNVTQFIYIGGEVKAPGEKTFRRGLTLMQAIIGAGGATPKSKIAEIGRDDGNGFLVGTRFILRDIQSGKIADPLLKPGDRVMIIR